MDLDQIVTLEPAAFRQLIEEDYFDNNGIYIGEVYNALMSNAVGQAVQVARLAEVAVEVYSHAGQDDETILYLELQIRALLCDQNLDQAMLLVERIAFIDHDASETTVLELAEDILSSKDSYGVSVDQRPRILAQVARLIQRYGQQERVVDLYLEAASLYSSHGAFQPAYRCLGDAEGIANSLDSSVLKARCYAILMSVACEENDYSFGVSMGELAISTYQALGEKCPAILLGNLGVAFMNLEDEDKAIGYFEQALASADCTDHMAITLRGNLSICLRRCGRLDEAEAVLSIAEAALTADAQNIEGLLEISLSGAKLAVERQEAPTLIQRLQEASHHLDRILSDVLRLHHRRGIRERYITRIEGLLRALPPTGNTTDALLPIIATRGNAMGDWLTILNWASNVRSSRPVPDETIQQLDNALQSIREIGAPHLYGFREKGDDAWSVFNTTRVWDDLSNIAAIIHSHSGDRPLDHATAQHQSALCLTRLKAGHCLMVMTYAGEAAMLWYFIGDHYKRISVPLAPSKEWYAAKLDYAQQFLSMSGFASALNKLISSLAPSLDKVFSDIAGAGCKSVRFIEDCFNDLPLIEFALRNSELCARMAEGEFEVRMVPALIEPMEAEGPILSTAAIVDRKEDLLLAPYESQAFTQAAGLAPAVLMESGGYADLEDLMGKYDALVVSTHGHSLKFFTDAYFAHLGTPENPHPISVAAMQVAAPNLQLRLALVNTCFSGTRSSRNFQKSFRTSDTVALPNLFLLNRKAIALASMWKISDTACFTLTYFAGEGLKLGLEPSAAVTRAVAKVRTSTHTSVTNILKSNLPESLHAQALERISGAPEEGMFSSAYATAGFTIHGLL
jgi:tetratricopeptide (TPR) repeat protein